MRHGDVAEGRHTLLKRGHAEHGRRAAKISRDSRGRRLIVDEIEWCGMPHPAAQRLAKALLMTARNVQKGRRTRPAVEIFVAAADGKIDFVAIEEQVHGSRAVAQIPKHKRAAI